MRIDMLDVLRCPHCGDRLTAGDVWMRRPEVLDRAVLYDHCAAYPVVDGIAYLRADAPARAALHALGRGDDCEALAGLLGAGLGDIAPVVGLLTGDPTFREAVSVLVPGPEADYLLHRFSDPVYRASDHLFRAAAAADRPRGPVLDFGSGAGHLARGLVAQVDEPVLLADVSFPKLWLAARFAAPSAVPVCCDGNQVLPFAPGTFAMVTSSDAFHYVWSRQLLASELRRVCRPDGVLAMTHLHNLEQYNPSAGMPLPPAGYRRLLGPGVRLLSDDMLLDVALADAPIDIRDRTDEELHRSAALAALVGPALPARLPPAPHRPVSRLSVNPLYRPGAGREWVLTPPNPEYDEEYAAMHRYLPSRVSLPDDVVSSRRTTGADVERWVRSAVLLDLPDKYV